MPRTSLTHLHPGARDLIVLAERLGQELCARECLLAVAESCTGGTLAALLTEVPGSSAWFERGFVSYSNASKQELLGVTPALLRRCGAVSPEVACAMARGAVHNSPAGASVAITGIAGPAGGSADKPVGTVCLAWCLPGKPVCSERAHFDGDRGCIRLESCRRALSGLLDRLQSRS